MFISRTNGGKITTPSFLNECVKFAFLFFIHPFMTKRKAAAGQGQSPMVVGPAPQKKKKKPPDSNDPRGPRALKKESDEKHEFSTVKCCWRGLLRGTMPGLDERVQEAVCALTRIRFESRAFHALFAHRCLAPENRGANAANADLFDLTSPNAADPFVRIIAGGKIDPSKPRNLVIQAFYDDHWLPMCREENPSYEPPVLPVGMAQLLHIEREKWGTCVRTMAERTFVSRFKRLFDLENRKAFGHNVSDLRETPSLADSKIGDVAWKAVRGMLFRAKAIAVFDTAIVQEAIDQGQKRGWFSALVGLPKEQIDAMQIFFDKIRALLEKAGPVPVQIADVARRYHEYARPLLTVLEPLEIHAREMQAAIVAAAEAAAAEKEKEKEKNGEEGTEASSVKSERQRQRQRKQKLTFPLWPVGSLSHAAYVDIDKMLLRGLIGNIKTETERALRKELEAEAATAVERRPDGRQPTVARIREFVRQQMEEEHLSTGRIGRIATLLDTDVTDDEDLFKHCFDMRRVGAGGSHGGARPWRPGTRVSTDGVGASVMLKRLRSEPELRRLERNKDLKRRRDDAGKDEDEEKLEAVRKEAADNTKADKAAAERDAKRRDEDIRERFASNQFSVLIGIDPGANEQTAVVVPLDRTDGAHSVGKPGLATHKIRAVSKKEWREETGVTRRCNVTKARRASQAGGGGAAAAVTAFEALEGSFKTFDPGRFDARVRQHLRDAETLLDFYVRPRFFRRLRFDTFVRGQRGRQRVIDKLLYGTSLDGAPAVRGGDDTLKKKKKKKKLKQPGEEKDILVGLGDGHSFFHQRLERDLACRVTLVKIDEFRTSKFSSRSHEPLYDKRLSKTTSPPVLEQRQTKGRIAPCERVTPDGNDLREQTTLAVVRVPHATTHALDAQGKRKTSFAVRTTNKLSSGKSELWNRDVNASIWIGYKLWLKARGEDEDLPAVLKRPEKLLPTTTTTTAKKKRKTHVVPQQPPT